jgi:hypothetical protein
MSKTFRCQFFLDFFGFIAVSGVSQRWEFKNTTKTRLKINIGKKSDPGPFLASDPPTHHGGHRFVFWRPFGSQLQP